MTVTYFKRSLRLAFALLALSAVLTGCTYRTVVRVVPAPMTEYKTPQRIVAAPGDVNENISDSVLIQKSQFRACPRKGRLFGLNEHSPACLSRVKRCHCQMWFCPGSRRIGASRVCAPRQLLFKPRLLPIHPLLPTMPSCHIRPRAPVVVRKIAPRCPALHAPVRALRSSPRVIERYVAAPVERCGCTRPYQGRPYLTGADMTFITHGYGKRATTGIWVQVVNRTFTSTLVRATNWQHTELQSFNTRYAYAPRSIHTFALPLERSVFGYGFFATQRDRAHYLEKIPGRDQRRWFKSDCRHLLFQVGIMARGAMLGTTGNTFGFDGRSVWSGYGGHDRWDFTAILTLHFSDGSAIIYERPFVLLDSTNDKLVLTRFR